MTAEDDGATALADEFAASPIAGHAGAAAEPLWRAALDDPRLYAKIALTEVACGEPAGGGPDLELSRAEIASMLADSVVSVADGTDRDDLPAEMSAASPPEHEEGSST